MKKEYTFTVLRYIHDITAGEFINVGVALYSPKEKYLDAICVSKYGRLSKMFLHINGDHFKSLVCYIEDQIHEMGDRFRNELQFSDLPRAISDITNKILPKDDSSLQFSEQGGGLTDNLENTLKDLYDRYVNKYMEKVKGSSRDEGEVWKVYKNPLEKRHIIKNFKPI